MSNLPSSPSPLSFSLQTAESAPRHASRPLRFALFLSLAIGCAQGSSMPGEDAAPPDAPFDSGVQPDVPVLPTTDAGPACGNGNIDTGEECDGANLNGGTCEGLGYIGGTLSCGDDCTYDKTACEEAACGNGRIDAGEDCDGGELNSQSCASQGFVDGTLSCSAECTFVTAECRSCGDGDVDPGEECDRGDLNGQSCTDRGFSGGTLACTDTCGFDESGCTNIRCGNGTREADESCDGDDLGGQSCSSLGFFTGTVTCADDCSFDSSACTNCGNGTAEGTEACDGADLRSETCASQGFTLGTLGCDGACAFDTSACETTACGNGMVETGEECDDNNAMNGDGCSNACAVETGWTCTGMPSTCSAVCGDGMVLGGEACDGADLNGATCTSRGFTGGGTLACDGSCAFDESGCFADNCGNGTIQTGEECDDGNTARFDGCDAACQVEPTFDLPVRLRGGDGSNHGRLEVFYEDTWRDVCDDVPTTAARQAMADVVCRQLGYTGTGHQFISTFGGGTNTPVMDDVLCGGSETTLAQCAFDGWNQENCSAFEAVGFRCMPGEGDIRLVDGPSGMEGRLQIYHSGAWGEVCDDVLDGTYAASLGFGPVTVCSQLGYRDGAFVSTYDAPSDTYVLDDVNCTGVERRLGDCPHLPWGEENCFASEGAGFRCEVYDEGDTRLVADAARNRGRIEILHDGVWGTVCDDFISSSGTRQTNFIQVACGQLGFEGAGSTALLSVDGGQDPVWMDDLNCAGSESSLASCPFAGWGIENCSHFEDIGLACTP